MTGTNQYSNLADGLKSFLIESQVRLRILHHILLADIFSQDESESFSTNPSRPASAPVMSEFVDEKVTRPAVPVATTSESVKEKNTSSTVSAQTESESVDENTSDSVFEKSTSSTVSASTMSESADEMSGLPTDLSSTTSEFVDKGDAQLLRALEVFKNNDDTVVAVRSFISFFFFRVQAFEINAKTV